MRISPPLSFISLALFISGAAAEEWTVYRNDRGCKISYPRNVFAFEDRVSGVARFNGPNEATFFRVMDADNGQELSLEALRRKYFSENVPGRIIYERSTNDFLVFSGYRRQRIFYARVELSSDKRTMCIFEVTYPRAKKRAFDNLVTRMSHSFSVK